MVNERNRVRQLAVLLAIAASIDVSVKAQPPQGPPAGGGGQGRQVGAAAEVRSLHVQGNVWMLVGGFVNAAVQRPTTRLIQCLTRPRSTTDVGSADRRSKPRKGERDGA